MRMISFNRRYVAGPESNLRFLDPQSDPLSMIGTISQSDLLVHARDSRNPKPILA